MADERDPQYNRRFHETEVKVTIPSPKGPVVVKVGGMGDINVAEFENNAFLPQKAIEKIADMIEQKIGE